MTLKEYHQIRPFDMLIQTAHLNVEEGNGSCFCIEKFGTRLSHQHLINGRLSNFIGGSIYKNFEIDRNFNKGDYVRIDKEIYQIETSIPTPCILGLVPVKDRERFVIRSVDYVVKVYYAEKATELKEYVFKSVSLSREELVSRLKGTKLNNLIKEMGVI